MRIDVQEKPMKIAAFWVSKAEAADTDFMNSLKPEFKAWKRKNYLPVVYEAGEENMEDNLGQPKLSPFSLPVNAVELILLTSASMDTVSRFS